MSLIKPKAPRWYRDEGGVVEACYQIPKKKGDGMKEPNITDARELGLLPSVTTILNVMAKPGLERWKLEQAIHSALTLPRLPGEAEDAFAGRVAEDMEQQSNKARDLGSRIHDAIAGKFLGDEHYHYPSDIEPYIESFEDWANDNIEEVHAVEKVVGGKDFGYAGREDLDCTLKGIGRTVIDFKTQGIKEGKKAAYWPDWIGQLAAYRNATTDCVPRIMSLVIDSRAPGPVWPRLWTPEEVVGGIKMFMNCYALWALLNDYDPAIEHFDAVAAVKQAREDYVLKQLGILPVRPIE